MSRPSQAPKRRRPSPGAAPTQKPLSPELLQGRAQTQLALGMLFVLSAAPTVSNWVRGDTQNLGVKLAGFAVTAFVLWQVYRGSLLALYITLVLSVLGGLALMLVGPLVGGVSLLSVMLFLAGLVFAVCGLVLYAHVPVKAFLEAQRKARQP